MGTILIGAGATRNNCECAPQEVIDQVQRWASLGRKPLVERIEEADWEARFLKKNRRRAFLLGLFLCVWGVLFGIWVYGCNL